MTKNIGISGTPEEIQIIAKLLELEGYTVDKIDSDIQKNSTYLYTYDTKTYSRSTQINKDFGEKNKKEFKASEFDQAYQYLFDTELFSTEYFTNNKKVVIHCSNEEEYKSISTLFEIKWYNSTAGWETYKESVCINIDTAQYGTIDFYNTRRNYTIIPVSFVLKFKKENNMKEFILPEKYIIKQNLSQEVCDYHRKVCDSKAFLGGQYTYLVFGDIDKSYTDNKYLYPELTLEEFETLVLKKENNMKEIIGYKLKDNLYVVNGKETFLKGVATMGCLWGDLKNPTVENINKAMSNKDVQRHFVAAGVLDLWFTPVYKEQEVILSIGKPLQRVSINKDGVTCDNKTMSFGELQALKSSLIPMLYEKVDWNVLVTEIKIGCSTFSIEEFNQVFESSKKFTS